uniref:Uncharacterized protein n=1 Tax=Anguilla anguilla TaxID=7936 RepID=A0A0E9R7L8_ANGAN
MLSVCVCVQ